MVKAPQNTRMISKLYPLVEFVNIPYELNFSKVLLSFIISIADAPYVSI